MLVFLASESRDIQIITGGGVEGLLPDAACSDIWHEAAEKYLSAGDFDNGMLYIVERIGERLLSDEAQAELLLGWRRKESSTWLYGYLSLGFLLLIALAVLAYKCLNANPKAANNIRYQEAKRWQIWFTVFGVLWIFPLALLALYYRRQVRNIRKRPVACPGCGKQMRLLSEAEEDRYLNPSQQAEEKVQSVDYDVWLCPSCMETLILPYRNLSTRYSVCPTCGSRTFKEMSNSVLTPATTAHAGKGQKTMVCQHCGYKDALIYTIPMIVAAAGGGHGRSGGSGGFSGGSFGGGMSFGGGSGGKF